MIESPSFCRITDYRLRVTTFQHAAMQLQDNQFLLVDERSKCLSVTLVTSVDDYLAFIGSSYKDSGGLEGQRLPLKTKTAIKIRSRMVSDLVSGAVLPPIVIGVVPKDSDHFQALKKLAINKDLPSLVGSIENENPSQIAVIDGMQRTTALLEAVARDAKAVADRPVRVELWIGESANSLIYRMLVLNTGQVPWDIKRQLETVYSFLLREIEQRVPDVNVFKIDDRNRRSSGGQYQSSRIIESYFAFTSRKPNVDIKERVAEDFARIDATESASDSANLMRFIESLRLLVELDHAFSRFTCAGQNEEGDRFIEGKDIFAVRAAVVGFVAAMSVAIYGDPGFELSDQEVSDRYDMARNNLGELASKLNALKAEEVGEFLELEVLNQRLQGRTGGVGDFEREVFYRAFMAAIKHGKALPNMTPCWRAA
jgi:hypothetical protein